MPSAISNAGLVVLLLLAGAATNGCGSRKGLGDPPSGGAGTTASAAGTSGGAGTGDAAGTGGAAGTSAAAGTSGLAGSNAATDAAAPSPDGDAGAGVATSGCGRPAQQPLGMFVSNTIQTMGIKPGSCADAKCGAWAYAREYFLRLPPGYDPAKAYPITFEGPGCGGKGNNLFAVPGIANNTIRVGLTPSVDAQAFHATNPNQYCFDDHDGDASVDWVFYENLYDKLAAEICFDRSRVFTAGVSTGARMANELACKYAGDALRPVRGVMASSAGLPEPKYQPTCSSKPMAGIWVHETGNLTNAFTETTRAITRAMRVSGCTIGTSYETAEFDTFQVNSTSGPLCKRVKGCPASTPLVVCPLPGNPHASNEFIASPAWATFLELFAGAPSGTP